MAVNLEKSLEEPMMLLVCAGGRPSSPSTRAYSRGRGHRQSTTAPPSSPASAPASRPVAHRRPPLRPESSLSPTRFESRVGLLDRDGFPELLINFMTKTCKVCNILLILFFHWKICGTREGDIATADELNNVSYNDTAGVKLSDGPFSEVLKSAEIC
nr:sucrose synthase 3 [Ipomoea batatas]